MSIKALAQVTNEDRYSRVNIRKQLRAYIEDTLENTLGAKMDKAWEALACYLAGDYYGSKRDRIDELEDRVLGEAITIENIIYDLMAIVMKLDRETPIQNIVGQLAGGLGYACPVAACKTAAEIIIELAKVDMFNVNVVQYGDVQALVVSTIYELDEDMLQVMADGMYLPPMLVRPNKITSNMCSGYLTKTESVVLKSKNHHDEYQALDALNIAQYIPLALDLEMIELEEAAYLKKPKTLDAKTNNDRMVETSRGVYNMLIDEGNKFYLTHKFDKRGREYAQGYHVTTQGAEYKKASIDLFKKEIIEL